MQKAKLIEELKAKQQKARSAWDKGVFEYAIEMLEQLGHKQEITDPKECFNHCDYKTMSVSELAHECSYGACFEIFDEDIAKRLCSPSELKKYYRKDGSFRQTANARETWLDVQARALKQAHGKIKSVLYFSQE